MTFNELLATNAGDKTSASEVSGEFVHPSTATVRRAAHALFRLRTKRAFSGRGGLC